MNSIQKYHKQEADFCKKHIEIAKESISIINTYPFNYTTDVKHYTIDFWKKDLAFWEKRLKFHESKFRIIRYDKDKWMTYIEEEDLRKAILKIESVQIDLKDVGYIWIPASELLESLNKIELEMKKYLEAIKE